APGADGVAGDGPGPEPPPPPGPDGFCASGEMAPLQEASSAASTRASGDRARPGALAPPAAGDNAREPGDHTGYSMVRSLPQKRRVVPLPPERTRPYFGRGSDGARSQIDSGSVVLGAASRSQPGRHGPRPHRPLVPGPDRMLVGARGGRARA